MPNRKTNGTRSLPAKQRVRNPIQTRAKLLQATADLVAAKGVDALSLKEAAKIAKVSRAVAYQHFKDRNHLLREAKNWISDRLLEFVTDISPTSIEERVNQVAKLVLGHPEASKLLVTDALAGKGLERNHPLYKLVVETLEEFRISGGSRKDVDVEILSFIMLGSVATILMLGQQHSGGDIEDLARRFTREWSRILREGVFVADGPIPSKRRRRAATSHLKPNSIALRHKPNTR